MPAKITHFETHGMFAPVLYKTRRVRCDFGADLNSLDVRFPTSLTGDGTDAMCVLYNIM
jgi:hypothetical protein